MPVSPVLALWRHNLLLWRRDTAGMMLLIVMPLLMIGFLQPVFGSVLREEGFAGASGAEQAVPGMTVMFALFGAGIVGFRYFNEHHWGTLERLRASGVSTPALLTGQLGPSFLVLLAQVTFLLGAGVVLFGLEIRGSVAALALVCVALILCLLTYAVALTALCRSTSQLSAATNVGSIGIAGLGGAVVPAASLPAWAGTVAPGMPSYWAMEGFRSVTLEPGGIVSVMPAVAALLAFTAVFTLFAALRFRLTDTKTMD